MNSDDPLALGILTALAAQYQPVAADWVETRAIAAATGIEEARVNSHCKLLLAQGLIELSPPDEEHDGYAAIITVKGLLAIGRTP